MSSSWCRKEEIPGNRHNSRSESSISGISSYFLPTCSNFFRLVHFLAVIILSSLIFLFDEQAQLNLIFSRAEFQHLSLSVACLQNLNKFYNLCFPQISRVLVYVTTTWLITSNIKSTKILQNSRVAVDHIKPSRLSTFPCKSW